ncbi:hypothetical protein TL16_g00312 [Triparma laevis f. inornata]|uniref:Uncharacterized protein n=1 Tax=Triparma laevis f. inornata TaxID=1714386 RepID=A0A9W7DRX8_9STRA|nr:hypothetical protein TL16_g00312 [Triparma laevis f. inornata]
MAKKKKKPSLDATLDRLRGDKKKREKIPAYLRSALPQSKFILQPTDIQKMLPAEDILEKLQQDRVPKTSRKSKKLKRQRRKKKKWKIESSKDGEYHLTNNVAAKEKREREEEQVLNLPGVGRFVTCTLYNNDLKGTHGKEGPDSLRQISKGPIKIGGMKHVINRWNLTTDIKLIGLTEEQLKKIEEKKRRRYEERKAMGFETDSNSELSNFDDLLDSDSDEHDDVASERRAQPQQDSSQEDVKGIKDLTDKHNAMTPDAIRVEKLILDAENNKLKLQLAEKARKEAIIVRKKEVERLKLKAIERKKRIKSKLRHKVNVVKKVNMLKKLVKGFGGFGGIGGIGGIGGPAAATAIKKESENSTKYEDREEKNPNNENDFANVAGKVKKGGGSEDGNRKGSYVTDSSWVNVHSEGADDAMNCHHDTVDELHNMHRTERLSIQLQKNTDLLIKSESRMRRQSMMQGLGAEEKEKMTNLFLAERWSSLTYAAKFAAELSRHLRIVHYLKEKGRGHGRWGDFQNGMMPENGDSGEGEKNKLNFNIKEVMLVKHAVDRILKRARIYLQGMYEIKKRIMIKRMARLMKGRIAQYREDMKDRLADTIVHFMRDTKFNFAVFASVISRFRKHVLICQRVARAYLKCRKARLEALRVWFLEAERQWINSWRLHKKVAEDENKAMTTHAPKKVREMILLNCLNTEMFKFRSRLISHSRLVKESVAMVKQVGINDARAVIQGQVHFLERKKLVLKRPFYGLFTMMRKSNGMEGLVRDAHER